MNQSMTGIWIARIAALLVVLFCVWFFLLRDSGCNDTPEGISGTTIYKHDTTIVERVVTKSDTVIKWYDKVIYKTSEPVIVSFQKVDTVFLERAKKLDLMMKIEKKGARVTAYTINMKDTLLKESIILGVGDDFTMVSQNGGVYVKSKRIYWDPLQLKYEHERSVSDIQNKYSHNVLLLSGIRYMNSLQLNAGIKYDLSHPEKSIFDNTSLKLELIYKLFK